MENQPDAASAARQDCDEHGSADAPEPRVRPQLMGEVLARYRALIEEGRIEPDPAQAELAERLDALAAELSGYRPAQKPSVFGRLIGLKPQAPPRGLYIHGEVGRGKTFLMDLFYEAVEVAAEAPRAFPCLHGATCIARIHAWRQTKKRGEVEGDDPIAPVAAALAAEASLLCFDEFAVRDIADAMILARLFGALFAAGVVVVATSNVAPQDLYKDGLNRALFLPFLDLLAERMEIVSARRADRLPPAKTDPRAGLVLPRRRRTRRRWTPPSSRLTGAPHGRRAICPCSGAPCMSLRPSTRRPLQLRRSVPRAARARPISWRSRANSRHCSSTAFPVLKTSERNEAKRFITLIDALYDARVKLVASAEAEPETLGAALDGAEKFEFARAASRLIEMRSNDYLSEPHNARRESGDLGGLVET